jgi:hypothetical protein
LRSFLRDDDVVDILGKFVLGKIEAGLQGIVDIGSWQRTDVIAMFLVFLRPFSIDILVSRYGLAPIFREAIVFFPGYGSGHDLRSFKVSATVDHRVVLLKEAPRAFLAGWIHTGHQEDLPVFRRDLREIVKRWMFFRLLSIDTQVQIACWLGLSLFGF